MDFPSYKIRNLQYEFTKATCILETVPQKKIYAVSCENSVLKDNAEIQNHQNCHNQNS